jgi:DNA-binding transcriptional LysR family regulator
VVEKLRLFLTILREGSIRRAAERCHIAQSAITRQIQLLEHDLGGRILDRTSAGVRPTSAGHALAEKARAILADYDSGMAEVRRLVRGENDRLRIGYTAAAVEEYLGPALTALRRSDPKIKIKMFDQTAAEMISALRQGEIDLALTFSGGELLTRDFYTHKLGSVGTVVSLPIGHPLASEKKISISQLKNESFVGAPDEVVPGKNQKIVGFCRQFGRFRPRFVSIARSADLVEALVACANDGAISLSPAFISHLKIPNVVMIPIAEKEASWDVFVAWQRGKTAGPLRTLLDVLQIRSKGRSNVN